MTLHLKHSTDINSEDSAEDPRAIDRAASWIVSEIQCLMRVRIFGDFAKAKLTRFILSLDKKLHEFGLDESRVGEVAQESYTRLKKFLISPEK